MKDAYKNTAALFESALEAVIGTDGEQVVFMNPAAVSALGEHRGEAAGGGPGAGSGAGRGADALRAQGQSARRLRPWAEGVFRGL